MKKKTVINLLILACALLALYWMSYSDTRAKKKNTGRQLLLSDIAWNEVTSIELHKGKESILLEAQADGSWNVPLRNNYPASVSTIRSFMLKLMDLSSSQSIETTEEGIKKMSLDSLSASANEVDQITGEAASKGGVVLKGKDGKEIETLYLGALRTRKGGSDEEHLSLSGQFVRLGSTNEVYLIPLPLTFGTDVASWIEKQILKIEQGSVYSVEVFSGKLGEGTLLYSIKRVSSLSGTEEPTYVFSEKAPSGKEVSQTVVRQLTMALEDLKAEDVYATSDKAVADFSPEQYTVFSLSNGLVYTISAQEINGAYFLKIGVTLDENLQSELKEKFEQEVSNKKELEPSRDAKEDLSPEETKDKTEKTNKENEEPVLTLATKEELKKEQEKHDPWLYVVADFVGKKFLKDANAFFKEIAQDGAVSN